MVYKNGKKLNSGNACFCRSVGNSENEHVMQNSLHILQEELEYVTNNYENESSEGSFSLFEIYVLFSKGNLDVFPQYQRGAVFDLKWAQDLLRTILYTKLPIPGIYIKRNANGRYSVVDGAQRVSVILLFFMGAIPLKNTNEDVYMYVNNDMFLKWNQMFEESSESLCKDMLDIPENAIYSNNMIFHKEILNSANEIICLKEQIKNEDLLTKIIDLPFDKLEILKNKKLSYTEFPEEWSSRACILYVMYMDLKKLRQTKDECLLHLHDTATDQLRYFEKDLIRFTSNLGNKFELNNRKEYGCIFRVFNMLDELNSVIPYDADNAAFMQLMCKMVNNYYNTSPDEEDIAKVKRAIEDLNGMQNLSQLYKKKKLSSDALCIILYALCGKIPLPKNEIQKQEKLYDIGCFVSSGNVARNKILKNWKIREEDATLIIDKAKTATKSRDLIAMKDVILTMTDKC
ncbi:DUF262 domain-containing protein [Tetraselmis virus 1]|uniref:DUF262 domain-containing protein n=1 Tax=Tetraselmis virus 1 TaxID=2060617 RepID=A0A2P0VN93_9VIRU|nr:DUF262 domain-containing protein [Tetraselmis virus 1]AUF82340.1 DUF262 domain-containing protein [Tetraselmis virus 1]